MIEPLQSHEVLLADIRSTVDSADQVRLWWLGQSGFLLQFAGEHLLLDPYLSDSLTEKYAATDKPHIRMTAIPIDPAKLDMVRWITSTHNHTDHLDAETLVPLFEANPNSQLILSSANIEFAQRRLQCAPQRLVSIDVQDSIQCGGFEVHAVPAAHEELDNDEQGRYPYIGYVVSCGDFTIYHSGDTLRYDTQLEFLRPFSIDLAILPINGRAVERRVAGNLNGQEAAQLARDIHAACVIPCHYDMFTFNTESTDRFETACRELGQQYQILRCGEAWQRKVRSR